MCAKCNIFLAKNKDQPHPACRLKILLMPTPMGPTGIPPLSNPHFRLENAQKRLCCARIRKAGSARSGFRRVVIPDSIVYLPPAVVEVVPLGRRDDLAVAGLGLDEFGLGMGAVFGDFDAFQAHRSDVLKINALGERIGQSLGLAISLRFCWRRWTSSAVPPKRSASYSTWPLISL